jgi:hypothetical protein
MKIILLILFLIILIPIIYSVFYLSQLNKTLFTCSKENYINPNGTQYDPRYLLNCIISCYNDACNYDTYNPDNATITTLTADLKFLWFKSTNKSGLVYEFSDSIIIAFRGTHFRGDALVDSDAKYYTYPGTTIKVHKGFYNYYCTIKDQLKNIMNTPKQIYITGHSLGASVALILAYELQNIKIKPIVTLFGCPKTGNKDFIDSFNAQNSTIMNIVNYFDIVPEAPEKINQMYSVTPMYIFAIEEDSDVNNHSLEVYNYGIDVMKQLDVYYSTNSSQLGGYIPPTNKLKLLL